jgi:hypothetical protein
MSTAINVPAGFRVLPLPLVQLSLAAVLKCGQSFRWTSLPLHSDAVPTHEYRLCLRDRVVCLRQSHDALFYRSHFPGTALSHPDEDVREAETLGWIKDYFQLDVDLVNLYDEWSKTDPVFRSLRSRFAGIRMLRQDPWENLVSYVPFQLSVLALTRRTGSSVPPTITLGGSPRWFKLFVHTTLPPCCPCQFPPQTRHSHRRKNGRHAIRFRHPRSLPHLMWPIHCVPSASAIVQILSSGLQRCLLIAMALRVLLWMPARLVKRGSRA